MDFFFSSRYYIRVKSNLNALLSCKLGSFEFLEASNHTIISGYLDRISKVWIMKKFDIQSIQVSMYPKKMDIHVSKYAWYPSIQRKSVSKISKYPDIRKKWYPSIPIWHPGELEKWKSWGPFWSYQLNSTANPAHLPQNWAKLAKSAVLFS